MERIKQKKAELKELQDAFDEKQVQLNRLPEQLDILTERLTMFGVQEETWIIKQKAAKKTLEQIEDRWAQALALLPSYLH